FCFLVKNYYIKGESPLLISLKLKEYSNYVPVNILLIRERWSLSSIYGSSPSPLNFFFKTFRFSQKMDITPTHQMNWGTILLNGFPFRECCLTSSTGTTDA